MHPRYGKKQKILILCIGNIYDRKGMFNAIINRASHLIDISPDEIDLVMLTSYSSWLVRRLRHTPIADRPNEIEIKGVKLRLLWYPFTFIDWLLSTRLHFKTIIANRFYRNIVKQLKNYDLVVAHSYTCGKIALSAKKQYGIPYTLTWHGSDIHTLPYNNKFARKKIIEIIEHANINFFVSKALKETSDTLTINGRKEILYNGCDEIFHNYSQEHKQMLKQSFGVANKKVVAFAGGFLAIKNILAIPLIYREIYKTFKNVEFWMIGDGKFRAQVEELIKGLPVRLWGNQNPEFMPDLFNATDVLILPSINEGLPLTVVEGLKCGCNVVGSMTGGIPEVIGEDNCIVLQNENFIQKFADRVIYFLKSQKHISQPLDSAFDWKRTAIKENERNKKIMQNKTETA